MCLLVEVLLCDFQRGSSYVTFSVVVLMRHLM
jgi:hypothetical protein